MSPSSLIFLSPPCLFTSLLPWGWGSSVRTASSALFLLSSQSVGLKGMGGVRSQVCGMRLH